MIEIPGFRALLVPVLCLGAFALAAAGCGGGKAEVAPPPEGPLAAGLALLPDDPDLHRHVLVSDLARLRRAYPEPRSFRDSLVGVWLPDALVGANRNLWQRAFGLQLDEVASFASAGFHPAEVTVALGEFAPAAMRTALRRTGYRDRGGVLERGADGSIDVTTDVGRLALSSLNRVLIGPDRVVAASTMGLAKAADSTSPRLSLHRDFAAVASALDPITSAIVLDARLVRPPQGVPVRTLPRHSARLVAVGIDDAGPESRTLKVALVYSDPTRAKEDAALIEQDLQSIELPGLGPRLSDIASGWEARDAGRAVVVTARFPAEADPGTWRWLVERGDLAPLVRPGR